MKRRTFGLIASTLILSVALTGCGSKNKKESASTGSSSSELTKDDITLTVWESSNETEKFIKQVGEAFTKKHPNIKIKYQNVEVSDASTQIALDGPAGVGADVFAAPHDQIGGLVKGGHVLPVNDEETVKSEGL